MLDKTGYLSASFPEQIVRCIASYRIVLHEDLLLLSLHRIDGRNILDIHHSTVVRNIVVRATIKVNGKPQILGTSSPQTLESIDLKFDLNDKVGSVTLPVKYGTNRPSKSGGAKG